MDDIVLQAMGKWPNVPDCYGWLGLDDRGRWYMRDDATQAAGAFPESKGSWLQHEKLLSFIGRNYAVDPHGQWFFQNGPQRVYVELQSTPWIWRIGPALAVQSHTGRATEARICLEDEEGRVYLETPLGVGLVHSLDVPQVADALASGAWALQPVRASDLALAYGFVRSPCARHAARDR